MCRLLYAKKVTFILKKRTVSQLMNGRALANTLVLLDTKFWHNADYWKYAQLEYSWIQSRYWAGRHHASSDRKIYCLEIPVQVFWRLQITAATP